MATRQTYPAHFTDVSDPHPWPQPRACGHPRPALRVSATEPAQGRRLIGLSCQHLELGPLYDSKGPDDCYFDLDPVDLKGAEAKLLKKLIDDHRHYLPDDGCEFADRADYGAHRHDEYVPFEPTRADYIFHEA